MVASPQRCTYVCMQADVYLPTNLRAFALSRDQTREGQGSRSVGLVSPRACVPPTYVFWPCRWWTDVVACRLARQNRL